MDNCQNSLLFTLLILVILYLYYNNHIEPFSNAPQCYSPQFSTSGTGNDMEYCADIQTVGKGCQSFSDRDKRLAAFSIFGSYIDKLDSGDISKCMNQQGEILSQWGLCDKLIIDKIKSFGYDENKPRLKAIEDACEYYKKGHKTN